MAAPLKVAIIGLGTVGTGVARILLEHAERVAHRAGRPVELARAVVRDRTKSRSLTLADGVLTDDVQSVIEDESIDVAIQLMGGTDPARQIMLELLRSGKSVVTANKALLCQHGDEIFRCAREMGRCVAFEAAVAGGVPIVAGIGQSLSANQIVSLQAILNGTSNFILTEMLACGQTYEAALAEAQLLGYAEADPSMDVDGTDAAQKLVLLTRLAFGTPVRLEDFPRRGIDRLALADLQYAAELGYRVKLLAVAQLVDERLEMHVQPTLIRNDRPLAVIDGPFNMIAIEGDAVGRTWFSGPGAGQMPTASAVVADLIDVAIGRAQLTFPRLDLWRERSPRTLLPAAESTQRYYLRFSVEDRPHVFADIADILGRHRISLASIIQHESPESDEEVGTLVQAVPVVVMTHRTTAGRIEAAEADLDGLSSLREPVMRMPVAD